MNKSISVDQSLQPGYREMKQMLEYLGICYWLVDLELTILDINETFLELTGGKRERLVGRDVLSLVRPGERAIIENAVEEVVKTNSAFQFELYVFGKDKKIKIPMMFHLMMNRDVMNRPVSCNVVISDISTQKNLEEKERQLSYVRRKLRQQSMKTEMIGTGKAMESVAYTILRCAEVDTPVLITGETGVGKEVAARMIHIQCNRGANPFVAVTCGALPRDLMESELFGHVKGAFTGASENRPGLFREAEGGTLFLDEIGDIEKPLQVKLLRALQEGEIRPVGDDKTYKVNLRVICATNQELLELSESGKFRQDLYYRISVVTIHIPPLRERPEDIIKLAEHFISKHPRHKRFTAISADARKSLSQYHWPGNIRELQNAVEHAMVMSREKRLDMDALPAQICAETLVHGSRGKRVKGSHQKVSADKKRVMEALDAYPGSQEAAARALGISRVTLWRRKKRYGL